MFYRLCSLIARSPCSQANRLSQILELGLKETSKTGFETPNQHHRSNRWYEEGPLKGPLGRIEVQLTLAFIPLELLLLMDTLPDRVLIQPDSAHARSTIPQVPSEQRPVHVPQVSVTQMYAGNGRAFRSLTARGGGFVLD